MCSWRFESGKLKVCLSVCEFLYKLQAFYFYSFFIFPKIDILMTVLQMEKKKSLPFVQAWGSWNHFSISAKCNLSSNMWIYHVRFATVTKKSTLRYISHKSIVLTIIQCKEVPSLRFKLLAFLALVAQAVFPLRQQGTQKSKTSLLLTESQWKWILFSWHICPKGDRTTLQK